MGNKRSDMENKWGDMGVSVAKFIVRKINGISVELYSAHSTAICSNVPDMDDVAEKLKMAFELVDEARQELLKRC